MTCRKKFVEYIRDYIADLEDENFWDVSFERTQDNLVAANRKAKQEISAGQSVLMNYDQL